MCFYAFSEQGEIILSVEEYIWVHPKYYWKADGRSSIIIHCQIEAKSSDIRSIHILYPNLLASLKCIEPEKYAISRTFNGSTTILEVLRHFYFEVLTVTFTESIKRGKSKEIILYLDSPNASYFENDFRLYELKFTISGPDNIKRSFLQGLIGAEEWFKSMISNAKDASQKQTYEKMLRAKRSLDSVIVEPLNNNPSSITNYGITLFIDPALRGITIKESDELEDVSDRGIPKSGYVWPYRNRVWDKLFGEKKPSFFRFVYDGKGRGEHKFRIDGSAYRNKPTELYTAIIAILIMLLLATVCL
jgi:hypothetical protein